MADRSNIETARAAKAEVADKLAGRAGITGIGLGKDDAGYAVNVLVTHAGVAGALPPEVFGIPVQELVTGRVRAH